MDIETWAASELRHDYAPIGCHGLQWQLKAFKLILQKDGPLAPSKLLLYAEVQIAGRAVPRRRPNFECDCPAPERTLRIEAGRHC